MMGKSNQKIVLWFNFFSISNIHFKKIKMQGLWNDPSCFTAVDLENQIWYWNNT